MDCNSNALIDELIALIVEGRPRLRPEFMEWLRAYYRGELSPRQLPDSERYVKLRIQDEKKRIQKS